ncbi:hypothetical protein XA68_12857 [Ophiocordyceps unilateralis]|uniref:SWR1-complex protein 4 n=1 Tax=Ophiocordyceps unilateralis TaxID=268505 RepID=A0A2A9PM80_OPHUN|nr:hypothetical protein XA68_12857 [Ophiocordyceps unilateralis]
MAPSDVRDVLNLTEGAATGPSRSSSKKQKATVPKPNLKGLAREVHNLGGDNPIAIVPEVKQFKKRRRLASRKPAARWELRPFRNSGRQDRSLLLRHWRRRPEESKDDPPQPGRNEAAAGEEDEEMVEDSAFAKYSVRVSVPRYTDDQYRQLLQSDGWSREETDYLMDMVEGFDIRWPLIWDRYEWMPPATNGLATADGDESKAVVPAVRQRSMEDLKARYYDVASKTMAAQKPVQYMGQSEFALHELMAHFNPQQEKARKAFALNSLSRSYDDAREEESLLLEIKRILARSERFNEERMELYNRLDYPRAETDISSFKTSAGLQTLLQNLMNADKSKKRKPIMGVAADGVSPSAAPETAKRDGIAGVPSSGGHRDSAATPTGGSKKAQQQQPHNQHQHPQPPPMQERRKLTALEERIYGVTHHDRLGSGPTFRTEKINKLFSHKSNQQQMRINNALNELDVPSKLAMATAATTQQYEQLLAAVNSLIDARKHSDKLDGEIKLERTKRAEREKMMAVSEQHQRGEGNGGRAEAMAVQKPDEGTAAVGKVNGGVNGGGSAVTKQETHHQAEQRNGDQAYNGLAHKRSASVLSTASDKSAKRLKK